MSCAVQLGKHGSALTGTDPASRPVPVGWRAVLRHVDGCASSTELVANLYGVVKPGLAARYRALVDALDPIFHAELEPIVRARLARLDEEISWGAAHATPVGASRHEVERR